jgi:hypothetical protein
LQFVSVAKPKHAKQTSTDKKMPELGEQRVVLVFEGLASLLADGLRLLLVAAGEVRLDTRRIANKPRWCV